MNLVNEINLAIVTVRRKYNIQIDYMFLLKSDYEELLNITTLDVVDYVPTFWNIKFFIYEGPNQISELIEKRSTDYSKETMIDFKCNDIYCLSFVAKFDLDAVEVANNNTKDRPYRLGDTLAVSDEVSKDVLEWFDKFKHPFVEFSVQILKGDRIKTIFKGILKDKAYIDEYRDLVLSQSIKKFKNDLSFLN